MIWTTSNSYRRCNILQSTRVGNAHPSREREREREMADKLSRGDLIAIAEKLLVSDRLTQAEVLRLIEDFESNLVYPDASELIFTYRDEFRNAAEIVDFALGREKLKKLSREELIE